MQRRSVDWPFGMRILPRIHRPGIVVNRRVRAIQRRDESQRRAEMRKPRRRRGSVGFNPRARRDARYGSRGMNSTLLAWPGLVAQRRRAAIASVGRQSHETPAGTEIKLRSSDRRIFVRRNLTLRRVANPEPCSFFLRSLLGGFHSSHALIPWAGPQGYHPVVVAPQLVYHGTPVHGARSGGSLRSTRGARPAGGT